MRVAVCNPPGILDSGQYIVPFPSRCDWVGNIRPATSYYPYELGYLTSMLKLAGISARLFDGQLKAVQAESYLLKLATYYPDVLIAECGHLSYATMTRIAKALYRECGTKAILCGPYGTTYPEQARADGWDVVVKGEFEHKILSILRMNFADVKQPDALVDLDSLPLPEDEDVNRAEYWEQSCITYPMVQIYGTRGCTVQCDFCTSPIYYGGYKTRSHRTRNVAKVCDEIEILARRHPEIRGFFFNDETHNADRVWLRSLAADLINRGLDFYTYEAMCGYWTLAEQDIALLYKAGYRKLRFGAENLDVSNVSGPRGKRVKREKFTQVLEWCKEWGIQVHLTCMVGAMGSTIESDRRSLEALLNIKQQGLAQTIQHSICTPNPGTAFTRMCETNGWITGNQRDWHNVAISYPDYPAEQIQEMAKAYYLLDMDWREQ